MFTFLLLLSLVALVVGLVRPGIFSKVLGGTSRKKVAIIFGLSTFVFFIVAVATSPSNTITQETTNPEKEAVVASTTKTDSLTVATAPKVQEATQPQPAPNPATAQAPVIKTDREKAIEIIKANASAKWGTDYQMVNYTVKNQTAAYDWVVKQTQHPDIMTRAKNKWTSDYEMVKYTYENQVAAYEWIARQTAHPDIMARAKQKWGGDYEMVKYEYENQVSAYEAQ